MFIPGFPLDSYFALSFSYVMLVKYLECAKETDPHESSFTSLMQLINFNLSF